ncbi:MAG TPA: choline ABC transporter ATP-binding protein, partial [Acetobacteraceae bacterium]|nr:choline ABC transporter ATP-binding protein [Acetobacteraceae bacterium]
VDIIFGSGKRRRKQLEEALRLLDGGADRAAIAARTGAVLGVAGASLAVAQGQICVLMGLSGSGKSTLLRAANGLNAATRGQVLVRHGDEVVDVARCDTSTLRRVRMERVAMVFQQFALLPWRTVRENVGFGLELRGVAPDARRRIVDEKLALVGLDSWGDRYAAELSGGMQQRVGLARAFATDADILLMDEPFSALDPLIRTKLQDELLALQAAVKKTILFVSHDLDEALKLGNSIAIMEGGRIVQTGTPEDIVLRPADAYVAEFVQHMNKLNVLKAGTVMRRLADLRRDGNGTVWLDGERRYAVALDGQGRPESARIAGAPVPIAPAGEGAGLPLVAPDTPLREVVRLRQASGHPVLLAEAERLVGVCDDAEMLEALCGVPRAEVTVTAEA